MCTEFVIALRTPFAAETWAPILRREGIRGASAMVGSFFVDAKRRLPFGLESVGRSVLMTISVVSIVVAVVVPFVAMMTFVDFRFCATIDLEDLGDLGDLDLGMGGGASSGSRSDSEDDSLPESMSDNFKNCRENRVVNGCNQCVCTMVGYTDKYFCRSRMNRPINKVTDYGDFTVSNIKQTPLLACTWTSI